MKEASLAGLSLYVITRPTLLFCRPKQYCSAAWPLFLPSTHQLQQRAFRQLLVDHPRKSAEFWLLGIMSKWGL